MKLHIQKYKIFQFILFKALNNNLINIIKYKKN